MAATTNLSLGIREACSWVMERARDVVIDHPAIERLADRMDKEGLMAPAEWDRELHFVDPDQRRTANYVLALDALNFCFWGEPRWTITYRDMTYNGYWALAASLKRAIEDGFDLTQAEVLAHVTEGDLLQIFRGTGRIPLLADRVRNLREVGARLLADYQGQASGLIRQADGSAVRLVRSVVDDFRSFDDVSEYDGRQIKLYKRAQILAIDLHSSFGGQGLGAFTDLDAITAFADYKVPQVLREFAVLRYSPALAERIASLEELPHGSPQEVEIRAGTVVAVHELARALTYRGMAVREADLDGMLWNLGQRFEFKHPYHRTRTIYY